MVLDNPVPWQAIPEAFLDGRCLFNWRHVESPSALSLLSFIFACIPSAGPLCGFASRAAVQLSLFMLSFLHLWASASMLIPPAHYFGTAMSCEFLFYE